MLSILCLVLVPIIIAMIGFAKSDGRVTGIEFSVLLLVTFIIGCGGYWIALDSKTRDTEIWNGRIAEKHEGSSSCCHCRTETYSCGTDSKGNTQYCSRQVCDHISDVTWEASTTNGETAFSDGCNAPGSSPPQRWLDIRVGEPTAIEHTYTNYIRGNPNTVLRSRGVAARFAGRLPSYPEVYDHYRVNRVINQGVPVPNQEHLEDLLRGVNADLGHDRQVNITLILTNESDSLFLEAIRERWIGGKKNDLIVVIGMPSYPQIAWSGVISWTRNEDVKIHIRDRINALQTFDNDRVMHIVRNEVDNRFIRRPMADYEYLYASIEPPGWALLLIWVLEMLAMGGLLKYFWDNDPFKSGYGRYGRGFGRS